MMYFLGGIKGEKTMRAKRGRQNELRKCKDCVYAVPYTKRFLTMDGQKPVLCNCCFHKYMKLLDWDWCENFKIK